jgi:hypothetical protein
MANKIQEQYRKQAEDLGQSKRQSILDKIKQQVEKL